MAEAIEVAGYLRLRQICLVAPQLEPVISDISGIMGLDVCYRDDHVAKNQKGCGRWDYHECDLAQSTVQSCA